MLRTRSVNQFLGTNHTIEEVQEMDPLDFVVLEALQAATSSPS